MIFFLIVVVLGHNDHVTIPHYAVINKDNSDIYYVLDRCIHISENNYFKLTKKDELTVNKFVKNGSFVIDICEKVKKCELYPYFC